MNVTCPECRSIFRVDPAKVPSSGVRARCSVCGGIFPVAVEQRERSIADRRETPAGTGAVVSTQAPGDSRLPTPAVPSPVVQPDRNSNPAHAQARLQTPGTGMTGVVPPAPPAPAAEPPSVPPLASPTAAPSAPSAPTEPPRDTSIWGSPGSVPAQRFAGAAGAEPSAPSMPASPTPAPVATSLTPQGVPVVPPPPAPPPAAAPAVADAAPRRPVNPYLSNDPNQKARRLARALVSDLIAYHPQKREEGLRTGTLKQLFRDEIRKSWEEYVEQVGAPLAESTPHFQDALNDLLAGGRKVF
jgi:predicted Zn finger-like uncharacterized protein